MAERAADVVKSLMKMGVMATMNQSITRTPPKTHHEESHKRWCVFSDIGCEQVIEQVADNPEDLISRPRSPTNMGHVNILARPRFYMLSANKRGLWRSWFI